MSKSGKPNRKNADLVAAAIAFATAFVDAATSSRSPLGFAPTSGKSLGAAGIIEITEEVAESQANLRTLFMKELGSKAGHERAIDQTLLKQAHKSVFDGQSIDKMAIALIDAVFEQALVSYQYVAPNRLFRFAEGVTTIQVGSVRGLRTDDLQLERQTNYPRGPVTLVPGADFRLRFDPSGTVSITMFDICWAVEVDAIAENVEEEGKWLIDIAVSFLRLTFQSWKGIVPKVGDREPHPIHKTVAHNEGVKLQGPKILAGGGTALPWYEIDASVASMVASPEFQAKSSAIFAPTKGSLAARVSQGLGWLSRGRQSSDRAERLLYFFTAIEALLSGTDKNAPVVQTIARHAAVILTNDNSERARHASRLKSLYNIRSALVHNGDRVADWTAANAAQEYSEALFSVVLQSASLTSTHETFSDGLASASYGSSWPATSSASRTAPTP